MGDAAVGGVAVCIWVGSDHLHCTILRGGGAWRGQERSIAKLDGALDSCVQSAGAVSPRGGEVMDGATPILAVRQRRNPEAPERLGSSRAIRAGALSARAGISSRLTAERVFVLYRGA